MDQCLPYICEMFVNEQNLEVKDYLYQYNYNVDDPLKVPRGPFFTKQPKNVIFDDSSSSTSYATMT